MSNNVEITAGLGTTIETIDEGGGVERQVIVLGSIGDASGETQLSAGQKTSANSIPVVLASDQSAVPVSGTFWPTTQPVSGTVTANAGTNMSTAALALETGGNLATVASAQGASGTGISQPTGGSGILGWLSGIYHALINTITVSGTVTANAGTNMSTAALALESGGNLATLAGTVSAGKILVTPAQATASSLNATVVGTGTFAVQQPDQRATGQTINSATANVAYTVSLANGEGIIGFQVTGLTASGATLTIEATVDGGTTWNATNGFGSSTGSLFTTLTTDQGFRVNVGGRTGIRLRVSSTGTGTITVASSASSANDLVGVSSPLPPGTNTLGGITLPDVEAGLSAGTAPSKMIVGGAQYNSAAPSPTNGQTVAHQSDSSGNLKVNLATALPAGTNAIGTVLLGQTGTDGSTSITTGGTSQNLFGGTTPTNGFEICNPDPSNDLWISDSTTAAANGQGSYRVAPDGGTYTTPAAYKPIGPVSAYAATTGQKITARRW